MEAGKKIYLAKERWNCSFEELSFLLDLDKDIVMKLYHQEKALRLPKTITIDMLIDDIGLTERTKNCLKRTGIRTVKDLLTYLGRFDYIRNCGVKSVQEIQDMITSIQSVLKLTAASLAGLFPDEDIVDIRYVNSGEPNAPLKGWEIHNLGMVKMDKWKRHIELLLWY